MSTSWLWVYVISQMVHSATRTLILDNGGNSIKIGWSTDTEPRVIPNCIVKAKSERKRVFVGEELSECVDRSSLYLLLPAQRGYLVNWDVQQQIWERSLKDEPHQGARIVLTHPNCLVPAIKDESCEILFEMFGVASIFKSSTSGLIGQANRSSRCCLVVDSGFSFTHITPFVDGKIIQAGVIRIDVGGKVLTNQLKEWISYRELNVAEETAVMGECKEDGCFVSLQYDKDMMTTRIRGEGNTIAREYVLPDFTTRHRGVLRTPTRNPNEEVQKILLNVERFALPELLFHPSDMGIDQKGVAECVVESVNRCPPNLRLLLLKNIYLVGGCAKFANFTERLLNDVRSLVDGAAEVNVMEDEVDAMTRGWYAGRRLVKEGRLEKRFVSKKEYEEDGEEACRRAFLHFHPATYAAGRERRSKGEVTIN